MTFLSGRGTRPLKSNLNNPVVHLADVPQLTRRNCNYPNFHCDSRFAIAAVGSLCPMCHVMFLTDIGSWIQQVMKPGAKVRNLGYHVSIRVIDELLTITSLNQNTKGACPILHREGSPIIPQQNTQRDLVEDFGKIYLLCDKYKYIYMVQCVPRKGFVSHDCYTIYATSPSVHNQLIRNLF